MNYLDTSVIVAALIEKHPNHSDCVPFTTPFMRPRAARARRICLSVKRIWSREWQLRPGENYRISAEKHLPQAYVQFLSA